VSWIEPDENTPHPIRALCQEVDQLDYPRGVIKVRQRIDGTAFFPGGLGLWKTGANRLLPPMPIGEIMILGHDFHSEDGYEESLKRNGEDLQKNPTWRSLLKLLDAAGIERSNCFFTNFFPGIRQGGNAMGTFPGRRDPKFVAKCGELFLKQLLAQRPRIILILGCHVPSLIAPLADELKSWINVRSFKKIDSSPCRPSCRAWFRNGTNSPISANVVALTHPCMRTSNVHRRTYKKLAGHDAEMEMLRDAGALDVKDQRPR